jgi:glutathione S-transferase
LINLFLALPLGQIPVLKTEKLVINQSGAIVNWAVRNGDLPKLTDAEASKSDIVAETCREIVERVSGPAFAAMQTVDQSKKVKK